MVALCKRLGSVASGEIFLYLVQSFRINPFDQKQTGRSPHERLIAEQARSPTFTVDLQVLPYLSSF